MSVNTRCMAEGLPCHPTPLDSRRCQAARTTRPSPLSASLGVSSSPRVPPEAVSYRDGSNLDHSHQWSKRPPPLGRSLPSLGPLNSSSRHSPASVRHKLIPRPEVFIHRVAAATEQHELHPQGLHIESHLRCGDGLPTFYPSSHNPSSSPIASFPRLASTHPSTPMCSEDGLRNKSAACSSHCSTLKESTSQSSLWSRGQLSRSSLSFAASRTSSSEAPLVSPSRPAGGRIITKSIQSLLRRGNKTKQPELTAYPSLPSLNNNFKAADKPRIQKSTSAQPLIKASFFSSPYAHSENQSSSRLSSSAHSLNLYSRLPLVDNAYAAENESARKCSISGSSLRTARSFYSTMSSEISHSPATPTFPNTESCLPGDHFPLSSCQTAILTGSLPLSDKLGFTSDQAYVKMSIAQSIEDLNPLVEVTEASDGDESDVEDVLANLRNIAASKSSRDQDRGTDSQSSRSNTAMSMNSDHNSDQDPADDSEADDILTNLRSIAATKSSWNQDAGSYSPSSLQRSNTTSSIDSDQDSDDCSDTGSDVSFDAAVDGQEGTDYFPLPSWPALSSTSQSPLQK